MQTAAQDLIEFVIPTYDRPESLRAAVDSALSETPLRVTVLDDNSPEPAEHTLDVERLNAEHDGRLRVIRNAFNLGASLNILRALEVSRAPYTWSFSDDMLVPPGAFDLVMAAIDEYPDAAIHCWNPGVQGKEQIYITQLSEYIDFIERSRAVYGFTDTHFNRVLKTDVGRRYTRFDARFSHAQPMLGIQIAAMADGLPLHIQSGAVSQHQPSAASSWSASYTQRFKLDPAYLISDPELRSRYRAVVAKHIPWRFTLIDPPREHQGSLDEAFAVDAGILASRWRIPLRIRIEARLALFLRMSRLGRLFSRIVPKKRGEPHPVKFDEAKW